MEIKPELETFAKIKVIGVGGGGGSAITRMYNSDMRGVDFVVVNTDAQALHSSSVETKIQVGKTLTKGLGAGMNPEIGRQAVEEDQEEVKKVLDGSDMVFITYGLGGGSGSGGGPVVAEIARELGALTVGVVTKPFTFEGVQRKKIAEESLEELKEKVDTLITIPNDKLLQIVDKKTSLIEAFAIVDEVLKQGVQGISDLITIPGIVNVDFADVKSIMQGAGSALMGIGSASGENRAKDAAKRAIESPLLELSVDGANGVLFNITGGDDLGMFEVDEAAKIITESIDSEARVIFGAVRDKNVKDEIKITVIATGFSKINKPEVEEKETVRVEEDEVEEDEDNIFDFEEKEEEINEIQDKEEDYTPLRQSQPEFERDSISINKEEFGPMKETKNNNEDNSKGDELDIPAFIRRKME